MKRILSAAVIAAPIGLALIVLIFMTAPRLVVSGASAAIIYYVFWACSAIGFFGSLILAATQRRLLWLIPTISTVLLFGFIFLMSAGLAMSRWH